MPVTTQHHELQAPGASDGSVDPGRPFLAHVRMSWWRALLIMVVLMAAMIVVPALGAVIGAGMEMALITGGEPPVGSTGLMILVGNLAVASMGLLTLAMMRWIGKVPIRACFTAGRAFSWRRLVRLMAVLVLPMVVLMVAIEVLAGSPGEGLTITSTTVIMLVIVLLTAPLQAAGEEIVFPRGGIGPAAGSWARDPRWAVGIGLAGSSILFGVIHFPSDPWLIFYYPWLGLVFGLMAVISRGLEAPIALHAVNNVVTLGSGVLLSGGGPLGVDRSAGGDNANMIIVLILVPAQIILLSVMFVISRRQARSEE